MKTIRGQLVDVFRKETYPAQVDFDSKIRRVARLESAPKVFICPGFVDAHVHTESSMLIPSEFARLALRHGTVAVVADPHEIANVLGIKGVEWMIRDAKGSRLKFCFGASPCVPATRFETAGAKLGPREIGKLLRKKEVYHLSEVMNYPGVVAGDPDMIAKISLAKKAGKPVDGHCPGLSGEMLRRYVSAGIQTDHECSTLGEAREKAKLGMKILVREGSAAKNLGNLHPILEEGGHMLCGDDTHPDDLLSGHMDRILRKCVALGVDPLTAVASCTKNTVEHYGIPAGLLREGDSADFVLLGDLMNFRVKETWVGGKRVFPGKARARKAKRPVNSFFARALGPADFAFAEKGRVPVIGAIDGEIVTEKLHADAAGLPDTRRDILKIAVINRYENARPAIGFIKNFGLGKGALGSSVMHDSHNIGVVGADDESMCRVANEIMRMRGGLAVFDGKRMLSLPLPFAGLMSGEKGEAVAKKYKGLSALAGRMGCRLKSPFMTLSFMGLLVIPHLKISDRGMFDADKFEFVR
ncbi:MAG TPA: adenine deaminase [Candidatus Bilamarchaeum sp.]|nr:adenine deaminase [Candidatus Bilamarchaeum sp.]